jgi:predicted transcriptional regulator
MWWFLIGMFLRGAAQSSYRQVLTRSALAGEKVRRFMVEEPVSVVPSLTLGELVNDYVFKYHYKMFPVTEKDNPVGCITVRQLENVPKNEWGRHTVSELATHASDENTISPDADAVDALALMNRTGNTRLMVVDNKRLIGIISLKDMLKFLSLKMELETGRAGAQTPG